MILLDYSQVAISNVFGLHKELKNANTIQLRDMLRHSTLSTIKFYKRKYSKTFGDLVLCCDSKEYWRKVAFPYYKAKRKVQREKSDLNWHEIFDTLDLIKLEIKQNFPYKMVEVLGAEADDVIAVMAKWIQTNKLIRSGLVERPEPTMIISADNDFKQLHLLEGIRQYSPIQKKDISSKNHKEITDYMMEHIIRGDDGDGVPNILSPDNVFVSGSRQKPLKEERLAKFIEAGIDECQNDEERKNFERNRKLVNFDYIPEGIQKAIVDSYLNTKVEGSRTKIFEYLMHNRCRRLMEDMEDF